MVFIDEEVIQMLENLIVVPWHFLGNDQNYLVYL